MKNFLIQSKNEAETKFINDLLKKLGIKATLLSTEEFEDIGLAKLMKNVDRTKKVSRDVVMKKLRA